MVRRQLIYFVVLLFSFVVSACAAPSQTDSFCYAKLKAGKTKYAGIKCHFQ